MSRRYMYLKISNQKTGDTKASEIYRYFYRVQKVFGHLLDNKIL